MNVDNDEARHRDEAFGFEHPSVVIPSAAAWANASANASAHNGTHRFDDSVNEDEVGDLVEILAGIDDTSIANDEPAHAWTSCLS